MTYGNLFNIAREQMYPTPYQNSSLLPLLLLSLATQKHSPDTTTHIRHEYDYIIVGAGSAGSVVAGRLSEIPCVSVLLLEAGDPPPLLSDIPAIPRTFIMTDIDWNYLTEPQKYTGTGLINRQMTWPSGKTLGGSSVHNGMLGIRGNREDYDDWARLGARGWSWKDVFPYFVKLEDNTDPDIAHNGFHGIGGPVTVGRAPYTSPIQQAIVQAAHSLGYPLVDPNGRNQIGFSDFQTTVRRGQRCSTAKAYLVPSENRENLDIVSGALVTKILMSGNTAVGVQFDRKGQLYEVRARKEVIMSAGAVNTAQLLMLSGIGPRSTLENFQIPVVADLPVGLTFQDHCAAFVNFVVNAPVPPLPEKIADPRNIKLYANEKIGPLASTEGVINMAFFHNNRWDHSARPPDHQIYFLEAALFVPRTQINIEPSVYQQIYGPYENKTILWCLSSMLHPKSNGYVSIRSSSPYDPPVIDPNYFEHPDDIKDTISGMKACLRIAETKAMQKLGVQPLQTVVPGCEEYLNNEDLYLECGARAVVFTLSHQVGTAKMGDPRDPTTVVDPELRVKGIKGLRVIDASVMPKVPSGNTNLPVIMLAEKASDIIKGSVNCY